MQFLIKYFHTNRSRMFLNTALAVAVCYAHCAATSGRNIHFVRKAPDGWSCDRPETQLVQYIRFGHELQNKTKQKE